MLKADLERDALLREAETADDPHRIAEIQTRLVDIDAHSAPARAAAILSGLGFSTADQARPCSEFSGGWRMRVALAATLFAAPDLLLLDEPTNYLDLEGTLWLEDHLANYPRTVIVISHDRDLLDVRMRRVRAERRAARVPSEVMQLVAGVGHLEASDHRREGRRVRVEVEHVNRVAFAVLGIETEGGNVAEALARSLNRHPRRRIKSLVGFPKHGRMPLSIRVATSTLDSAAL